MPIKKLSVQLANQIAAGEVVENPASVVKELLENAIDAHATLITLEIAEAGKLLIRVTDNGSGIPSEELPLALSPHATSKILELKDLEAIMTLGFRGEALASIAAVSKLSLISNTEQQDHGCKVEVEGPEQKPYIYPAAHPVGTTVIVRELFFNTPARRRFLKSNKSEFSKIKDIFNRIALVNYHCEFYLIVDGKNTIHLPITNRECLELRMAKLLGSEYKGSLIKINNNDASFQAEMQQLYKDEHFSLDADSCLMPPVLGIYGVLLYPKIAQHALSDRLVFFLNGRCMSDKLVVRAVREGVMQSLKSGVDFKPSVRGVLFLECDPHIVDVNVHPRKDEVRFHDSSLIFDCIVTTIKTALKRYGLTAETFGQGDLGLPSAHEHELERNQDNNKQNLYSANHALGSHTTMSDSMSTTSTASDASLLATMAAENAPDSSTTESSIMFATEKELCSDSDDIDDEIEVKAIVSLETEREVELRAKVEQYFARYPSSVRVQAENNASANGENVDTDTDYAVDPASKTFSLRGACCDFSRLQAGLAALTVLRQAQQAVSSFKNPSPRYGADSFEDHGRVREYSVETIRSELKSTPASAATMHFDLNKLLLQQERNRNQDRADVNTLSQVTPTSHTKIAMPTTTNSANKIMDTPPNMLYTGSGMVQGERSYSVDSVGTEASQVFEDSGRVIVDKARSFAQTMQMLQSSNNCNSSSFGASAVQANAASKGLESEALADAMRAHFLALVAPNVVLFSLQQRYFLGKGSDLLIECVAKDYAANVQKQTVQSMKLLVPFAILLDAELLQSFKRPSVERAAQRCGFVLQVQLGRGVLELHRIPNYLVGCNLAAVVPALLPEIVHGAEVINGELLSVEELNVIAVLCLKLARAREYEINTAYDARLLLKAIGSIQQLEPLLQHGTLHELNLHQLAQQMLQR